MAITRRQLLKMTGLSFGGILFAGCTIRPGEFNIQSPSFIPEDLVDGTEAFYATLCRQCQSAEGLVVRVMEGRAKKVEGNPDYPMNTGKHSARCEAALQAVYHPDRISSPLRRSGPRGSFQPISWEAAQDELRDQFVRNRGAAGSVAVITAPERGHLGMLVGRFSKAYGARHLTFEALEQTTLREAVKRVFGQDRLPAFDIEHTKHILSFGADFLGTWLSPVHYSRQYGEFRQGDGRSRGTLVQIEPRMSLTAANADEWVPVKPGSEGLLAMSIASVIIDPNERLPRDAAAAGALTAALGDEGLGRIRPDAVTAAVGISAERIREIARAFAKNQPGIALAGGPAGAQTNGLFNLSAAYLLNMLVGNIGKDGGVKFNPSPALNDLSDGVATPFQEWQKLTERMSGGGVSLVLVHGANPVYGLPSSVGFEAALDKSFVVSFSSFMDETTAAADLVLPVHTPLEEWGDDVPEPGPGYQVLGFQQPVVRPFVDSRGFGDLLLALAEDLGMKQDLPWDSFQDLLRDGASRLRRSQGGARTPGLIPAATDQEFWVGLLQQGGWWNTAKTAPATVRPGALPAPSEATFAGAPDEYPMNLIPFPSQSMGAGEGAHLPWLQATPDPLTTGVWDTWVEMNPKEAREMGLRENDVVRLESSTGGSIEALVYLHPAGLPGIVAVPMGQGHLQSGQYAKGRGSNVLSILAPETVKETGALAWGATRVRVVKTGRRVRLPKLEGFVVAVEVEGFKVAQVTRE
jgi:anaerobic selenocysteine-containing dehydrogenase